ncbi:MAG TPA: S8 family serine peptidase, partial [Pyrinomonadaceae bacterium]|nr:S8 family serine peptidase [Pyrinomonadaceae bacterium]
MKTSTTKPMIKKAISISLILSFAIANLAVTQAFASTMPDQRSSSKADNESLTTDLTQLGRQGRLLENLNLEAEVMQLIKVLGGKGVRQPLILDEKNENQDILVEQVAIRIANGSLPRLADRRILKLEAPTLFSHVNSEMEAEARLNSIIDKAIASKGSTILYFPRFAGIFTNGGIEKRIAASILRGELKIIAGSSFAEYADKIESDLQLAAAFDPIKIDSHTPTKSIIDNSRKENQNRFRGQKVAPDLKRMIDADPSKRVDLIVQAADADSVAFRTLLANGQARIVDRIGRSDMLVVNARLSSIEAMAASGMINYVSPNRKTRGSGHIEDTTGATAIRSALSDLLNLGNSVDGTGVGVAVLDSGIYAEHNGFKNLLGQSRIVANVNFTDSGLGDAYGHGTHVAGLAAGNGLIRGGAYGGIAPDAKVISVKVLNDQGVGETSWLLNGLDWVLQNKDAHNIKVVNLSLGTLAVDSYTNDPLCLKVKELAEAGIVVIAAAGNLGKNSVNQEVYGSIHSPGNSPYAITIGASNTYGTTARDDDSIATYSSRGPTRSFYTNENGQRIHDNLLKPDLVAPGNKVVSFKSVNSHLTLNPDLAVAAEENETADDGMMYQSGTSMAAPVVAGAAALLFEVNPNLTPGMVKMLLQYSAQPIAGADTLEQGAGQLNIEGAVRLAKSLKKDLNFNAATNGTSTVPFGWSMPSTSTTIDGHSFQWAQLILTHHAFVTGTRLVSKVQGVYRRDRTFGSGE